MRLQGGCAVLLAAMVGCGNPKPAGPAPAAANDVEAARALFDEAVRVHMAGDEVGWRDRLLRLAVEQPDTPYGRAAARRLGGSGTWVMTTGVLASIAIPAFMKYIRRSKTAEATMNVRRMYDGAVAFYAEHHRFPQTTPLTPDRPACAGGSSAKIAPQPEDWSAPGWKELGFAIEEPSYYHYEFVSEGEGPTAAFTARAVGDLDCNGVQSTFERIGTIDAQGNVNGGAGLFTLSELE
jgi:hypothetical protein